MRKYILVLFIFFIFYSFGYSQYYVSGSDPASIKWEKIETKNFRIVFPNDYRMKALQIAGVLENVYVIAAKTLGREPDKMDVLIHAHTAYSNGFVSWAPKRIELYPTPGQNMYSQNWLEQLSVHEYRHVVQISQLDAGFTHVLKYIFGEQSIGAVLGLYVPLWFLEGDAVSTETALSESGRGRLPWFEQGMRAQILEKGIYSYDQAYFGTYNHYTPNYYELGYLLVAGGRSRYGSELWGDVLNSVGKKSYSVIPFHKQLVKNTSFNKDRFYYSILDSLRTVWQNMDANVLQSDFKVITKRDSSFVSLKYPVAKNDSVCLAELSGPGVLKSLVEVDKKGSIHTIITTGSRNKEPFSYVNHLLCWTELEPDIRWDNTMYSNIILMDTKTRRMNHLTHKGRYFSPSVSPDGNLVAAVYIDENFNCQLSFLRITDDSVVIKPKPDSIDYIYTPHWSPDGTKLVCVVLRDNRKQLALFDVEKDSWEFISTPDYTEISLPDWKGDDEIIFTGSYSGKEEIYSLSLKHNQISQLTSSKFGANGAFYRQKDNTIVYSYYTSDGYQLVSANVDSLLHKPLSYVTNHSVSLASDISAQESHVPDLKNLTDTAQYKITKYSKWNLFNFHSWAPAFINLNDQLVYPGLSGMSQNLLGTAVTTVGYNADPQMSAEKYYLSFDYSGLYPVINFEVKGGYEKWKEEFQQNLTSYSIDTKQRMLEFTLGTYVPFNLKRNKYYQQLKPAIDFNYYYQGSYGYDVTTYNMVNSGGADSETERINVDSWTYTGLEGSLYYYRLLPMTDRDATYRWGQIFDFLYQISPVGELPFNNLSIGDTDFGSIMGLYTKFYFPGVRKYHSVSITGEWQKKKKGDVYSTSDTFVRYYGFGNYFSFARGYDSHSNDELFTIRTDYIFPVVNPDLSLNGFVYLKRINADLFFDYSRSKSNYTYSDNSGTYKFTGEYKSVGAELRCETHFLRFLYPFTIGGRYSYLIDNKQGRFDYILGINISGFSVGKNGR